MNNERNGFLRRLATAGALCFCLTAVVGCAVGPNFSSPQTKVPDSWVGPTSMPATQPAESAAEKLAKWWTMFRDPLLTSLIERAVESNLDLKLAEARILEARANRGVAVSGIGPTLSGLGSYQRSQASAAADAGRRPPITNQYQAGFDAGWEIDIFGGVRRNIEAADADLRSAEETRQDVLITLSAEVARNYIDLRTLQQRIVITRRNLESQKHSAGLTHKLFEGEFVSKLDVANADAQVATTTAGIPALESSARQTIYSLSVLLGRAPGALMRELSPEMDIPAAPPEVPAGVPSELLRRRPDIRSAEADIHAATARIGVATADLFPKFNITGSIGYQTGIFNSWFDPLSRFWSFGPSVSWDLFNTGRNLSNIKLQKALTEESLLTYRQVVLTALQEVEAALIASAKEQERRTTLVDAVTANRQAVDLSTKLYTEGQTDFLNVLNAQRALLVTEEALAQSTGTVSTNLVALYKALGGGWQPPPDEKAEGKKSGR